MFLYLLIKLVECGFVFEEKLSEGRISFELIEELIQVPDYL
jgi:hypothetical protein